MSMYDNLQANDHGRLVALALADTEILGELGRNRKIVAIKRLRTVGKVGEVFPGLKAAKDAIEDDRVKAVAAFDTPVVMPHRKIHVVVDAEGERMEMFSFESDAQVRVDVLNQAFGPGFAWYDTHTVYGLGRQPERLNP